MSHTQEQANNQQFNALAGKLAALRNLTEEINSDVRSDNALLDHLSNGMQSLLHSVKTTSSRLTRAMASGNGVWRNVGLALVLFVVFYSILKLW